MIRVLRLLLALYVLVVLQTTLVPSISFGAIRPDLLFLLVLLVAFHEGAAGGAIAGFLVGLFVDLESARTLGTASLAGSVVGFGTGLVAVHLVRSSIVTRMIVTFLAVVMKEQLVILVSSPTDWVGGFRSFLQVSIPSGLYTALISPLVMGLVGWLAGWRTESGRGSR